MNIDLIKSYENVKNTIKEEQSFFIGYLITFFFGYYIIFSLFKSYNWNFNIYYGILILIYFMISIIYWFFRFNRIKYKKGYINILFFPFENSILNKDNSRKYEINNEIYKMFYNAIYINKNLGNNQIKINIIKMSYKYNNYSDTELLDKFSKTRADIIIRGNIINDGNNIGISPVFYFGESYKKNKDNGEIRYLINCWNLISKNQKINLIELTNFNIEASKKSLDEFNMYIGDLYIFFIMIILFFEEKIDNKTYLNVYLEILNSSISKYGDLYDIYIYSLIRKIYDKLGYSIESKLDLYTKQEKIMEKYNIISLKSEYFFSIYHEYGKDLFIKEDYKKSYDLYKKSFLYKPNRHSLFGFLNLFNSNKKFSNLEISDIKSYCEDFININKTVFSYGGYKLLGIIYFEYEKNIQEARNNFKKSLDILKKNKDKHYKLYLREKKEINDYMKEINDYMILNKIN